MFIHGITASIGAVAPAGGGTLFDMNDITTPITSKAIVDIGSGFLGMTWGDSGSKMYLINLDGNVNQYAVGTPYDVTTLVDTGSTTSFDVSTEEVSPGTVEFDPTGTKMYVSGTADAITQYTLSTPWLVTSAGSPVTGATEYSGWIYSGIHFNSTGTKLYMVMHNFGANAYLVTQTLSTGWDITSISATGSLVVISSDATEPTGIHLSDDGTLLQISSNDFGEHYVLQYLLSTPFDETSGTLDFTYDSSVLDDNVYEVTWNADGSVMYLYGHVNGAIFQIPLAI